MKKNIPRAIAPYARTLAAQFPVLSIQGPRQSGKTTLARNLFPDYDYVNLENPDLRAAAEIDGASFLRLHPAPLVIDEVQRVPSLISRIQVAVDERSGENALYVLTGSHQPALRSGVGQSLAGRVGGVTLLPLSIDELAAAGIASPREQRIVEGFMPRLFSEHQSPFELYRNYAATYLEKDVSQLTRLRERRPFEIFVKLLAGRVGQLFNSTGISDEVGVSAPTLRGWLSILEACHLVFALPPYYRNFGKRFVKSPKIYFTEPGLAAWQLGIREVAQVARDPAFGGLFENMVVVEALKTRLNAGRTPELYFIRDQHGTEIDLVVEDGGALHLFEIKASASFSADFTRNIEVMRRAIPCVASATVVYGGDVACGVRDVAFVPFCKLAAHMRHLGLA
ncbi:MAG: ATP-binding protein [Kiritimatiellia bacterium]